MLTPAFSPTTDGGWIHLNFVIVRLLKIYCHKSDDFLSQMYFTGIMSMLTTATVRPQPTCWP